PQLAFDSLCSRLPEVQRFEETIDANQIRQVGMKIGRANRNPLCPKALFDAGIPAETFFRFQRRQRLAGIRVESKDFVLTARWTKTFGDACVKSRVRLADEVTAGLTPGPDIAELIEVIEPAATNEN